MSANTQTIVFSGGALVLSIVTLALTQVQRMLDTRRIVRSQLTDVLTRITDMQVQSQKSPKAMEYLRPAGENQVRLAAVLADQLPARLVNDLDYLTMASAAADPIEARQYYEKAIRAARTPYYRSLARSAYGLFLFESGDDEGGSSQFRAALTELSQPGDEGHAMRFVLYQGWAWCEQKAGHTGKARTISQQAEDELSKIQNRALRREYSGDVAGRSAPHRQSPAGAAAADGEPEHEGDSREVTSRDE